MRFLCTAHSFALVDIAVESTLALASITKKQRQNITTVAFSGERVSRHSLNILRDCKRIEQALFDGA